MHIHSVRYRKTKTRFWTRGSHEINRIKKSILNVRSAPEWVQLKSSGNRCSGTARSRHEYSYAIRMNWDKNNCIYIFYISGWSRKRWQDDLDGEWLERKETYGRSCGRPLPSKETIGLIKKVKYFSMVAIWWSIYQVDIRLFRGGKGKRYMEELVGGLWLEKRPKG